MQLVIPFDINGLLNIGVTRDSDRRYSERVIWSRSTPSQGGLGWNLGYGGGASPYQQADLTWRMQNVQLQGGLYGETGNYSAGPISAARWYGWTTPCSPATGSTTPSSWSAPKGYPQVPIRYENQLMGSTDDNGHLLVPWVAAYYPAKFQIEPLDLPANVSAPEVEQRVAVRQGSGLLLDFPIRAVVAASISLVDERGEPAAGQPGRRNRQRPARQRRLGRPGLFRRDCKATTSYAWSAPTAGPARHASAWTRANPPSARSAR